MRTTRTLLTALVAAVALMATACGASDTAASNNAGGGTDADRPTIIATTSILGDLVTNVVGDLATVEVLMPPGTDPHDFEPSARQVAGLRDADLIVANGMMLEEGLIGPIEAAEADGVPVLEVAPAVDPLAFEDGKGHSHGDKDHDHDGDDHDGDDHDHGDKDHGDKDHGDDSDDHGDKDHDHDHGDEDPHVWQDPLRMAAAAGLVADAVAEATGLDAATLNTRAEAYASELVALDAELVAAYGTIPAECRKLVTDHDAFGYLADRYDFEIVGTIIPTGSELAEPSAAQLARLADTITEENVTAIFSESIFPPTLAEALARETGGDVALVTLYSDSLGAPGSDGETYVAMMRTNAERITGALC